LSSTNLLTNADYTTQQIFDIADKLEEAESQQGKGSFAGAFDFPDSSKPFEDKLSKVCKDMYKQKQ
jgi:COP9 signalosome complex subunit 5